MEPNQPTPSFYPEFDPPTYLQPPPPPKPRRDKFFALILLACAVILAVPFTAYFVFYRSTSSPITSHTNITPTLDAKAALLTDDFSKFLEAFTLLLERKDYAAIQTATDTENFQAIPLRASGIQDWQEVYGNLTAGAYYFVLSSPPLTPDQAGYSCFGYESSGITYLALPINALQLRYIVGTAKTPGTPADANPFYAVNGTVFVFELPDEPSPTWLWRAVTYNNSLGCGT